MFRFISDAFDYFLFHFCDHGMKNFHKTSLAALNINHENLVTVYYNLTADYFCNFLPSQPNGVVFPVINISNFSLIPIKDDQSQFSNMSSSKSPKYLMMSNLSKNISQNHSINKEDFRYSDKAKSANWRTESALFIFVDSWLRYDFERELPGNEFMRIARILVKQLHYFSNSADMDLSSLSVLRRQAQTMLTAAVYPFLNVVTARWPLDTSFLNVLEFWLSFIQPWRYVHDRELAALASEKPIEIPQKFKAFVKENLNCYTQIFVKIISRFLKMDLNSNKNVYMMFRMIKVFSQLQNILKALERSSNTSRTPNLHEVSQNSISFNSSAADKSSELHGHSHNHSRFSEFSVVDDSNYVSMFSSENLVRIHDLLGRMMSCKDTIESSIKDLEITLKRNFSTWEKIANLFGWMSSNNTSMTVTLEEKKKTKIYLDFCLDCMATIYEIPADVIDSLHHQNFTPLHNSQKDDSNFDCFNPSFIRREASQVKFMGDTIYMPIRSTEIPFVARFVHQVSVKFNEMFEQEMAQIFGRSDIIGKISRFVLEPPEEIKVFNKSAGYSQMESYRVGPRLNLRNNYILLTVLVVLFVSLLFHLTKLMFV